MRVFLAAALALPLSACFVSERPLFASAGSHCPAVGEFDAAIVIPNASDDGQRSRVTIDAPATGGCRLQTPRGNLELIFTPASEGVWVVQITPDARVRGTLSLADDRPLYVLARHEDGGWLAGPPLCDFVLNGELMTLLNIRRTTVAGESACSIDSAESLQTIGEVEGRSFAVFIVLEERSGSAP